MQDNALSWPEAPGLLGPVPLWRKKQVTRLPLPTQPPPGLLEDVGRALAHRAVPHDATSQAWLAGRWAIALPPEPEEDDLSAVKPPTTRTGAAARRALQTITRYCPPPAVLTAALSLSAQSPSSTSADYRAAVQGHGLSHGEAAAPLVRGLASVWRLEVQGCAALPGLTREEPLREVSERTRSTGPVPSPEPPAGEADWYRQSPRVAWQNGYLVAIEDRTSALRHAVVRQLTAVGPLPLEVLAEGAQRLRPELHGSHPDTVAAWLIHQPDLALVDGLVHLPTQPSHNLDPASQAVLDLFRTRNEVTTREITQVLNEHGFTGERAREWLDTSIWLRPDAGGTKYRVSKRRAP